MATQVIAKKKPGHYMQVVKRGQAPAVLAAHASGKRKKSGVGKLFSKAFSVLKTYQADVLGTGLPRGMFGGKSARNVVASAFKTKNADRKKKNSGQDTALLGTKAGKSGGHCGFGEEC